jgi:hypothetical protein
MRTVLSSYEPVFGVIVATLAGAFLCLVLVSSAGHLDSSAAHLSAYCGVVIAWGVAQVIGYRSAKRRDVALAEPVMDTAVGCVFLGLLMGLVTVLLYEFSHTPLYATAAGFATAVLLCVGAFVGIRRGTWK